MGRSQKSSRSGRHRRPPTSSEESSVEHKSRRKRSTRRNAADHRCGSDNAATQRWRGRGTSYRYDSSSGSECSSDEPRRSRPPRRSASVEDTRRPIRRVAAAKKSWTSQVAGRALVVARAVTRRLETIADNPGGHPDDRAHGLGLEHAARRTPARVESGSHSCRQKTSLPERTENAREARSAGPGDGGTNKSHRLVGSRKVKTGSDGWAPHVRREGAGVWSDSENSSSSHGHRPGVLCDSVASASLANRSRGAVPTWPTELGGSPQAADIPVTSLEATAVRQHQQQQQQQQQQQPRASTPRASTQGHVGSGADSATQTLPTFVGGLAPPAPSAVPHPVVRDPSPRHPPTTVTGAAVVHGRRPPPAPVPHVLPQSDPGMARGSQSNPQVPGAAFLAHGPRKRDVSASSCENGDLSPRARDRVNLLLQGEGREQLSPRSKDRRARRSAYKNWDAQSQMSHTTTGSWGGTTCSHDTKVAVPGRRVAETDISRPVPKPRPLPPPTVEPATGIGGFFQQMTCSLFGNQGGSACCSSAPAVTPRY